ncbi:Polyprotein P3 [Portunus trituberculatus]|uniref:Polyprotein P3 n=1 Tax=Portunus trituberculatus TaxID=210409 RepID=A0A5B7GYK5_PORTR|nr:Polyprotein P3 [Portunus trituberculatus]
MGHYAASDAYTKRFNDAIEDIPRRFKCVDDTLLFDSSMEQAFWHVYHFLETCAKRGITLQPEKFPFAKREVDFVGFSLGSISTWMTSWQPSNNSPCRPNPPSLTSGLGLVNQLAPFMDTAPAMEPFWELLKKPAGKRIYWDLQLQRKFELAKDTICRLVGDGLVYYDYSRPTAIVTDWSKEGLGFIILQQYCSCMSANTPFCCRGGWRLTLCEAGIFHLLRLTTRQWRGGVGSCVVPTEGQALSPQVPESSAGE